MSERIMRLPEIMLRTGLSRASVYSLSGFPKPVKLGRNMSGWVEREVDTWIEARIEERDGVPESGRVESSLQPHHRREMKPCSESSELS